MTDTTVGQATAGGDRETAETTARPREKPRAGRLGSLDAYRGLIMISLSIAGFGLAKTAGLHLEQNPDDALWQQVRYQFSHAEWAGCSFWDLIQPSFMFMVGVSLAFSYAKRESLGHSYPRMLGHAVCRAAVLILLSIFLMSLWSDRTNWGFMNVLAQIGLGYAFVFLLRGRSLVVQAAAAVLILGATQAAWELYLGAGLDVQQGAPEVGVTAEWAQEHLTGIRPPWHKNANLGHAVDLWLLNRFPREESFEFNRGGYQTINFIPSLVTMLFGLMCGEWLRSERSAGRKLGVLLLAGVVGLVAGQLLHLTGASPLVKRIWTPGWTLFSTGWCCLIMAGLYGVIDVAGLRRWSFPLVVVGMNSIAVYCMSMTLKKWTARQLETHLGEELFTLYGRVEPTWSPTVQAVLVGSVFWLVCLYLYRNRIMIRI